ncbi:cyclase family protein [Psychroserpens sp.]|uniref:cyclase family protein n=1 Tax=Psychroserpens sp. TaxID=2020870 RepID=UPI001B190ED1|nr:cyclase family protein [Psychroserpens sp.]MBO6605696.1 cyclase family protein [Psychroserpens sp.]MBO6630431.1 cyclase family protein [Psychroserpens sp.]MBO6652933.1 cyclase family protein [Psychroserpens sp.]MBO6681295.1 cyclase family protein [Psychroserpens sp.]MBO6749070.1 cyclase family protein [Psychroserpens sp.]
MIATIQYNSRKLQIDLSKPLDISIPLRASTSNVNAWYIDEPKIAPVVMEDDVISVAKGASVNFNNIQFNPHAHGTHTECVGHITETVHSVNQNLKQFFFLAEVITIAPEVRGEDTVISKAQLQFALGNKKRDALVIRTLPNTNEKLSAHYSHTNWTYFEDDAMELLVKKGIKHLLIDQPSVDREEDGGELRGHNIFWNTAGPIRKGSTITEFIFVPNDIDDGEYFLNLQIAPFENDATPSKPVLYKTIS